jgi:hypothetical protein
MQGTRDTNENALDDGGTLDPRGAAVLLEQTQRRAQREFDINSPVLSLLGAATFLAVYGAIWLSVRGQHPYEGPSLAVIGLVYAVAIVGSVAGGGAFHRRIKGLSGHSLRQWRAFSAALVMSYVAVYGLMGALKYDGANHAIVYGVFAATAPLIAAGPAVAAFAAAREDWLRLGLSLTLLAIAAGSAYAGPIGVWAVAGVGCCLALLLHAAVVVWLRRG